MAKKNYVFDTNVLLHDPRAIYGFADNHIIVPIYVLEEIDNFKKEMSELGRNARQVARYLDDERAKGHLGDGVPLDAGGTIRVASSGRIHDGGGGNSRKMDDLILRVALEVRDLDRSVPTILVTKDVNMRIRGDALGLDTVRLRAGADLRRPAVRRRQRGGAVR